ncbi:hypothetical protein C7974DRAFT_437431 [Boeremia exigua]|uniref:uncharacterized protein n=1 Tax=Boeremia exigua TaxID=749465 RepID=UPI001E8EC525|nr:uncharacterized protein C7974DRAFT_437431 [Boeremia exigua]KAH6614120.1 hypothetical protein C7974DRAFT_437431 [Boeremia exigua]
MTWPFGRRSGRAAKLKEGRTAVADRSRPVAEQTIATQDHGSDALHHRPSQRSGRRRRTSSRSTTSLHDVEKNPFGDPPLDPGLAKEARLPNPASSVEDITALPRQQHLAHSPHLRPVTQDFSGVPYNFQSPSHTSLRTARERGKLQRPQSLRRGPPNETSLMRRKSSKRRKEHDHIREEEIRAMALPMPQKRPAGNSGGMLRRDSKKVKGGLNARFERPQSNISLPLEDSIHSSMSGNSELRAFRVSALDFFAPRPTIRFSVGTQYYYSGDRSSPTARLERSNSRKEKRPASAKEDNQWKRTSRIDDLADTLDAGALREILDRDKRRQEKKARADQERLRRRLERRAEKQNAAPGGTPPVPARSDAVGAVGLGIEKETAVPKPESVQEAAVPMEDVRPPTPSTPPWLRPLTPPPMHRLQTTIPASPDNDQLPTPIETPMEDMIISDAQAVRYSRGSIASPVHTRGPSNVSMMPELLSEKLAEESPFESVEPHYDPTRSGSLHPIDTIDTTTSNKGSSFRRRSSDGRRMSAFASFFRRSKRSSQEPGRTTPSEASFSNTSRESMSRQPIPAHLIATVSSAPIQIKRPSSVPRRTMSKFREDLPEFPISPPDSRVASPEVPSTSAIAARRRTHNPENLRVGSLGMAANARSDSPVSPGLALGNKMSQSLASVDSEGSWLSGRPVKRISNKSMMRSSIASSAVQQNPEFNNSFEELGMTDDEYFKRLTPQPEELRRSNLSSELLGRKASSTAMATLDAAAESEEEEDLTPSVRRSQDSEHVQAGLARHPTVIHRNVRVKSAEGLLTMFDADAPTPDESGRRHNMEPDSPQSDDSGEQATVQRAKSVDFGKHHVRHLSAGSAKLLDIQKRSSAASPSRLSQHE